MLAVGTDDDGASASGPAAGLIFGTDRQTLDWPHQPAATAYDVVKGSLGAVWKSSGDFAPSITTRPENDGAVTRTRESGQPGAANDFLYLFRTIGCVQGGPTTTPAPDCRVFATTRSRDLAARVRDGRGDRALPVIHAVAGPAGQREVGRRGSERERVHTARVRITLHRLQAGGSRSRWDECHPAL